MSKFKANLVIHEIKRIKTLPTEEKLQNIEEENRLDNKRIEILKRFPDQHVDASNVKKKSMNCLDLPEKMALNSYMAHMGKL